MSSCCDNILVDAGQPELQLYSCYKNITQNQALGAHDTDLMHVYGGSFTAKKVNPVTEAYSCPKGFLETNGFDDLKVCLAEKIETHAKNLPSYGGMFSCDYGNVATELGAKECPAGYSVYVMAAVGGDCLINVCLKFDTYDNVRNFPDIVLPPFFDLQAGTRTVEGNETASAGEISGRMGHQQKGNNDGSSSRKSYQVKLGLSIGAVVVGVTAIATVGIFQLKKYRKRRAEKANDAAAENTIDVAVINT